MHGEIAVYPPEAAHNHSNILAIIPFWSSSMLPHFAAANYALFGAAIEDGYERGFGRLVGGDVGGTVA